MLKLNNYFRDMFSRELKTKKISLRQLASLTGVSASTLSDKFGGKSIFNLDDVELIARELGITIVPKRDGD